ncbi:MAG: transposase [Thermacetogeniaceae bacterium]
MARRAREKSESGIYHIILRGTNRQEIFHDDEDCRRFLKMLVKYKKPTGIKIYGWCLMGNHIHLLFGEGNEEISLTMKRVGVSYASYYNWKYAAVGHLFQDRFRSEMVDSDTYLLAVIRYIHQNPVKAGLVKKPQDWQWSSCSGYYGKEIYPAGLLDSELILGMSSGESVSAITEFRKFNEVANADSCLDNEAIRRFTDDQARAEITKIISISEMTQIKNIPKLQRDEILARIKKIKGITQRQAARILGISATTMGKA